MPVRFVVAGLVTLTALATNLGLAFAVVIADAAGGTPTGIIPIISGGGAATAVGGIVYIARLMATGRLVAREPAVVERRLLEVTSQLTDLVKAGHAREDAFVELLKQGFALPRDHH